MPVAFYVCKAEYELSLSLKKCCKMAGMWIKNPFAELKIIPLMAPTLGDPPPPPPPPLTDLLYSPPPPPTGREKKNSGMAE